MSASAFAAERPKIVTMLGDSITAGFGLGQIAGPIVAGVLLDRTHGFAAPSLVAASAVAIAAVIAMRMGRVRAVAAFG